MKLAKRLTIILLVLVVLTSLSSCGNNSVKFEYWNDCDALNGLKQYVKAVTDKTKRLKRPDVYRSEGHGCRFLNTLWGVQEV